jgi:hypothetical protein
MERANMLPYEVDGQLYFRE